MYIYSIPFHSFQPVPEMHMQDRPNSSLNIKDINLLLLLFANDMVVLGETPEDAYCFREILVGLFCITKIRPCHKQMTNFSQGLLVCYEV